MLGHSAVSEFALSELAQAQQSGTFAVTLDGISVAITGSATSPVVVGPSLVPAGAPGKAKRQKLGWAWVDGKIVYGTQADIDRAVAALQKDEPKPAKTKTTPIARKLADLPQIEVQFEVPYVDILSGTPAVEAYQAQLEVEALMRRMVAARLAEQDDEEAILLSL